jgi:hypothetical protein
MFNPLSILFGWRRKVRKLRKRWDRLREKTLKKDPALRARLLPKEDQIEQNLRILEERHLHRGERARLAKELEIDLEEVKALLDEKAEKAEEANVMQAQQQKQKVQQQAY